MNYNKNNNCNCSECVNIKNSLKCDCCKALNTCENEICSFENHKFLCKNHICKTLVYGNETNFHVHQKSNNNIGEQNQSNVSVIIFICIHIDIKNEK